MFSKKISLSKVLGFLAMVLVLMPITSCSKDDDPDGGGNGGSSAFKLDGQTLNLPYAYWWASDGEMHIEFTSWDQANPKDAKSFDFLSIDYSIPSGQTEIEDVTLESAAYSMYVAKDVTLNSDGWQGETEWRDTTNSDLIIEKDGKKVKITIERASISNDSETKILTVNFNGTIKQLPKEFWDD